MNMRLLMMVAFGSVWIAGGCVPVSTSPPVPIATLVAQGIPSDLVITYHYSSTGIAPDQEEDIRIIADGSTTYTHSFQDADGRIINEKFRGKLPPEVLQRIVLAFEEEGFFGANAVGGLQPKARVCITEAPEIFVSIQINGLRKDREHSGGCHELDASGNRIPDKNDVLGEILLDAVKDLPLAKP